MKPSEHDAMVCRIKKDIDLLSHDLTKVSHDSTKRFLENEIAQKEIRLRFTIEKATNYHTALNKKRLDR